MGIVLVFILSRVVVVQGLCVMDGEHNHENLIIHLFLAVEIIYDDGSDYQSMRVIHS